MSIQPNQGIIEAIVEKVIKTGCHGPYAVASSSTLSSITFSLKEPTWKEKDFPAPGTTVILEDLRKKNDAKTQKGVWRAMKARYYRLSDESTKVMSNEKE